eukprot:TRINITY_DN16329_c0_g1_i2.p1 TRINITY_DN16329_c0_g1~~TRINITY_DN16329_c0_g1_i2.p1  ORF type:complete len:446 (+),score=146.01 TRINITY_DN16329_c0_g1_i2:115-1452(+)
MDSLSSSVKTSTSDASSSRGLRQLKDRLASTCRRNDALSRDIQDRLHSIRFLHQVASGAANGAQDGSAETSTDSSGSTSSEWEYLRLGTQFASRLILNPDDAGSQHSLSHPSMPSTAGLGASHSGPGELWPTMMACLSAGLDEHAPSQAIPEVFLAPVQAKKMHVAETAALLHSRLEPTPQDWLKAFVVVARLSTVVKMDRLTVHRMLAGAIVSQQSEVMFLPQLSDLPTQTTLLLQEEDEASTIRAGSTAAGKRRASQQLFDVLFAEIRGGIADFGYLRDAVMEMVDVSVSDEEMEQLTLSLQALQGDISDPGRRSVRGSVAAPEPRRNTLPLEVGDRIPSLTARNARGLRVCTASPAPEVQPLAPSPPPVPPGPGMRRPGPRSPRASGAGGSPRRSPPSASATPPQSPPPQSPPLHHPSPPPKVRFGPHPPTPPANSRSPRAL